MKISGRIEVFKGRVGLVGKIPAFDKDGNFTGAVYMPIELPSLEGLEDIENGTYTIMIKDAYLNCSTAKNDQGEEFTHLHIRVVDCEVLDHWVKEQPKEKKTSKKKATKVAK